MNLATPLIVFSCLAYSVASLSKPQLIEDSRGQLIKFPQNAKRIASTSLAGDEILLEILKETHQLNRLVAISTLADNDNYSNIANEAKQIKGRAGRELESLINLRPDLIFLASYNQPAMIDRLRKSRITTFVLGGFNSFDQIKKNISDIGNIIGAHEAAQKIISNFDSTLAAFKKSAPAKKYSLLNFSTSSTLSGKNTTFDNIIEAAGATNLANKLKIEGWSKISVESLSTLNPDYIVAIGEANQKDQIFTQISQTPGYRHMQAVKNKKIILVDGRKLLAVSHHVLEATAQIQASLLEYEKKHK